MVFLHIYGLELLSFMDIAVLGWHLCYFKATDTNLVSRLLKIQPSLFVLLVH